MKKLKFMVVLILIFAGCTGQIEEDSRALTLMTWNIHNLFDGEDDGFEYNEFRQSAGWSGEKYLGRINSISAAIGILEYPPDIIVFQEIESLKILEDLASSMPGFLWGHFAGNYGSAVGLGILSRFPLVDARAHSIAIEGDVIPRPVLELRVLAPELPAVALDEDPVQSSFVIFACHWKSKIGGDAATEKLRRASAQVILRRIRELWDAEPELGIIITGDLNENYDEFFRQGMTMICALMPDGDYTEDSADNFFEDLSRQTDFIVISADKPPAPRYFPQETIVFFSPWFDDLEKGSYYYRGNWETIDHFLVSGQFFNNDGWQYETTAVMNISPFANSNGIPISYNQRTGAGLSDHLPLMLRLINLR